MNRKLSERLKRLVGTRNYGFHLRRVEVCESFAFLIREGFTVAKVDALTSAAIRKWCGPERNRSGPSDSDFLSFREEVREHANLRAHIVIEQSHNPLSRTAAAFGICSSYKATRCDGIVIKSVHGCAVKSTRRSNSLDDRNDFVLSHLVKDIEDELALDRESRYGPPVDNRLTGL